MWSRRSKEFLLPWVHASAGSTISLKCLGDGKPTPNITWLKNGRPFLKRELAPVSNAQIIVYYLMSNPGLKYVLL